MSASKREEVSSHLRYISGTKKDASNAFKG